MADETDILLHMYSEEWIQARQSEDQRTTITNMTLLIASVILGFISQNGLGMQSLPLAWLLIVLGIYGIVTSEKLYETFVFHVERASFLRRRLDALKPDAHLLKLKEEADTKHAKEFPILNKKIRLYLLWRILHLGIVLIGIILVIMITVR